MADLHSNPIVVKVQGGTTRSDRDSLCDTCRFAHVLKGFNSEEEVRCGRLENNPRMRFRVAECTVYENRTAVSLNRMEDTAWILLTKKAGNTIGFVNPEEWKRINPDNDDDSGRRRRR
jgi:hypothetical protein